MTLRILSANPVTLGSEPFFLKKCGEQGLAVYLAQVWLQKLSEKNHSNFMFPVFFPPS